WVARDTFLADFDLDLARLDLFRLREPDLEDAVEVIGADLLRLDGDRELNGPLERARPALNSVVVLFAGFHCDPALHAGAQDVPGQGQVDVPLAPPGYLDRHDKLIAGLVDIDRRRPGAL